MRTFSFLHAFIALCATVLLLSACASRPEERFYILEAVTAPAPGGPQTVDGFVIGIGRIEIPAYLDRPQIVTKVRANELILNEYALWAEPLEQAVSRVMALDLAALTGAAVEIDPWGRARRVVYRLSAKLERLDGVPGGNAVLDVRWILEDVRREVPPITRDSHVVKPVGNGGFASLAEAYSELIADFSREVAQEIERLPR
ncbi:MAG: PqiC family protein [Syntrophaceae bacterium]